MNRFFLSGALALLAGSWAAAEEPLAVHEWGTFTSLQDEQGHSIGGINTDDEPVPDFVHRIGYNLLLSPSEAPPHFFQGAPSCHPDVTMRLETPVLYFHPRAGWKATPVDVHVAFRGGWLTEYYPEAIFRAPGLDKAHPKEVFSNAPGGFREPSFAFGHLSVEKQGELSWKGLTIGAPGAGPETKEKVWLAPREVEAAPVTTRAGEREKFLFYRGVGNVNAWLSVVRKKEGLGLDYHYGLPLAGFILPEDLQPHAAWLVQVNPDGACAFRALHQEDWRGSGVEMHATAPSSFPVNDFGPSHLSDLQTQMRTALMKEGLFADEADALLKTWQVSYFKSPGLRLFYLCPRLEIKGALPLEVSVPCQMTRVMIGRIEIVTPEQRALLKTIAAGPAPDLSKMRGVTADSQSDFFKHPENVKNWEAVMSGKAPYSALGLPTPPLYGAYLKLGRFRNALVLDEEKRRPTPALNEFITTNGFEAYRFE